MVDISLSAQHIVKRYGGVTALADGNLEVRAGEVVALMGANGSGKSTLGKIITGVVTPDGGQLRVDGALVEFGSPLEARKLDIAAVYQELSLAPNLTVAENVWLAHEPLRRTGAVHTAEQTRRTAALIDLFAGTVPPSLQPDAFVSELPPDERQIVEILKAISSEPRLLILDEATASLDSRQVNRLFELITEWKAEGMGIVFISHRMEEIFRVADRVTVLRGGESVHHAAADQITGDELVRQMIGSAATPQHARQIDMDPAARVRLRVRDLSAGILRDVSFDVRDGELLGIGGLRGQGQEELLLALFGAMPFTGNIELDGTSVHFAYPRQAMRHDVAYVPGDRASQGLLLIRSILENLHLPSWRRYGVPLRLARARRDAMHVVDDLSLVMDTLDAPVSSLSGGNAQKVVLGKWLLRSPKLLLLDDPTKGVDVGAKGEFYDLLVALQEAGASVLFYSSDDDELLGLCQRVLVLHDGQVQAELSGAALTKENLVAASVGTAHAGSAVRDENQTVS